MDLQTRLYRLQQRRYDQLNKSFTLSNAATKQGLSDAEKYLIGSMEQVSPQQTEIVLRTGERVKNQLESFLNNEGLYPEFDYQGSVTNNTHIKIYSDIDLIVASGSFYTAVGGAFSTVSAYAYDPKQTILTLRKHCKSGLTSGFPSATVKEKAKCIGISGGSLQRDVDVVPCNWIKNKNYERTGLKMYLGIRVLDVDMNRWIDNFPFLHNALLEVKDSETNGNLKRVIRLLKTLKEDANITIDVSSYDICGLAYAFKDELLKSNPFENQFQFLERFLTFSTSLERDVVQQASIAVPNGTRLLFSPDGLKVSELKKLNAELNELLDDVRPSQAQLHARLNALNAIIQGR